jgi:hypothetical protein
VTPIDSPGTLGPQLPRHEPPPELEQRVLATLTQRGLLAPRRRSSRLGPWLRAAAAIAAGIALYAAGTLAGRLSSGRGVTTDPGPRFALLLYGGSEEGGEAAELARVNEYRNWARGIAERGRYIAGEKLDTLALDVTPIGASGGTTRGPEALAGFFIIGAANAAEAETFARSCPHLRHGGRIIVRAIVPT